MSFGIATSVKDRVRECTPELLYQAMDAAGTADACAEILDALEQVRRGELSREEYEDIKSRAKRRLPVLTPHATFTEGRRCNGDAAPSGLCMYDIDHIASPEAYFNERLKGRTEALGIALAHVTPSTEGLRLVFVVPQGMTLEEAQRWMSEQLGDAQYDECVKDMARCSFLVPRDYVLYINEKELFAEREISVVDVVKESNDLTPLTTVTTDKKFKGISYNEIISEWWRRNGGEPAEGERNVKLHRLAVSLRAICDNRREVLMEVMPRFGLSEQEMKTIVDSACKEPPKGLSKPMREVLRSMEETPDSETEEPTGSKGGTTTGGTETAKLLRSGRMPLGLRESFAGVPEDMRMAVLCAVMPIASAYADQVEVEYCDGQRQQLGLMSVILGEQASGKSVCKGVVDVWRRQMDEEDAAARKKEEQWKERRKSRKANEQLPPDPKVLVRVLPVTVSCSTLLRRLKNAQGHTLYSFGEELDTLRKTNGAGSWSAKYDIYRLSFDHGEWGQDYNSEQAESGVVNVAYNWTLLGTYGAMQRCFHADNIENGLSSRVLVAEMPDASFAPMPKFGRRTEQDDERIQEAVRLLKSCSGFVDTPRLRKAIGEWVEQKRMEAARDIDRVKDIYRKRAAVIGFRCGVVYHLLTGREHETKCCTAFATAMAEYCLAEQTKIFGETLKSLCATGTPIDSNIRCSSNNTAFDRLGDTFTWSELKALKQGFCSDATLRTVVSQWVRNGWIEKCGKQQWKKCSAKA